MRILWLSLALSTDDYPADRKILIEELIAYSSSNFEAATRESALEKLIAFHLINDTVLKNLSIRRRTLYGNFLNLAESRFVLY